MSKENVALARRYCETFNARGLEGTTELRHAEIEVFDPPEFPDAGRYVGEDAVRRLVQSYLELGWDGQFHVKEYLDADEEAVVVWRMSGRTAHGGGYPMETTFAHVYRFEDGKLRRIRQYTSREQALEAAGLGEQAAG